MTRVPEEVRRPSNRGPAAAEENRLALIAAAREVYGEQGLGAPYSAVARRAGVGQGSLYRHFPNPVVLAAAVFDDNVAALAAFVAPPDRTLDDLFDAAGAQAVASAALIELTTSHRHDPAVVALGRGFEALVEELVQRDRAAGRVGAHVSTADVLLAVGMLAGELARTDAPDRSAVAERARALFRRAFAP